MSWVGNPGADTRLLVRTTFWSTFQPLRTKRIVRLGRRILVAPGFGSGHVAPFIAVARALAARKQEVLFYVERSDAPMVRSAGFKHIERNTADTQARFQAARSTGEVIAILRKTAGRVAPDLFEEIASTEADALLVDCLDYGDVLAAQASGLPWASMSVGPSLVPAKGVKIAQAKIRGAELRSRLGLPRTRLDSLSQGISPTLHLMPWLPEMDIHRAPPSGVHIGPLGGRGGKSKRLRWMQSLPRGRRTVIFSMSSFPFDALRDPLNSIIDAAISAFNELNCPVVCTLGPGDVTLSQGPRPHVRLLEFAPHELLMPHASVFVTHGGWGAISRCLVAGVPAVVLPLALDHPANGEVLERIGCGVSIPYATLTPELLYDHVVRLMKDDAPERRRSVHYAKRLSGAPAAEHAASLIEHRLL
jgi:UDP:flavonoid glycosyltransferase YjiC (YdhE family)